MAEDIKDLKEIEVDLSRYIKVVVKRKKTFVAVFLLIVAIGFVYALFSPRIYRISMMIQPPVVGPSLTGANDLESAENLKGLIINGAYNDELRKILNMDLDKDFPNPMVVIPSKTNILRISVDLEGKNKDFGVVFLQGLSKLISDSYAKRIEAKVNEIISQIKSNERVIINAKEKAKSLQDQIKGVEAREDKLKEEIAAISLNTTQILNKREGLLKNNAALQNESIFLLTNFIQNNLSYVNQLNNQFSELSMRRVNLNLGFKNTDTAISNAEMEIDKLNINKSFVSNLKIIAQPKVLPNPVSSRKLTILLISIVKGLFFGMIAVFLSEFWVNFWVKK
ncbi:MAG: Wzz/FepE/Etk N-terminal domain-containing protein [Candidatus Omnitrophica bacterium]|nr:Wzz/FepE/Etk N-terminal domain-containing protein [Candidatus Omnitrophota bacterium]